MDDYQHLKGKPAEKSELQREEEKLGFVNEGPGEEKVGVSDRDLRDLQALQNSPDSLLTLRNQMPNPKADEPEKKVIKKVKKVAPRFDADTFSTNLRNELQGRLSQVL